LELYCDSLPPFYSSSFQNSPPIMRVHSFQKSVFSHSFFLFGLIGSFHSASRVIPSEDPPADGDESRDLFKIPPRAPYGRLVGMTMLFNL